MRALVFEMHTRTTGSLGLLVIVTQRMMRDVLKFAVVFMIFVFGFAILLFGSGNPTGILDKCNIEYNDPSSRRKSRASTEAGEPADYVFAACTPAWFFMRTLLQGFGELFLEEMINLPSFIILILTFVILNVVLLNLLIAIMSGTYEEVSNNAKRQLMIEQYYMIKEHCRKVCFPRNRDLDI